MGENRVRFERELHRLRGFRFKRLLIVGTENEILKGGYRSNIKPQAVIATLRAFEARDDLPVVFCETAESAAGRVESWVWWFAREIVELVNDLWRGCQAK
jgi:hypothetical protein